MKKIRVMTVFGTRPEAIKMAPLVLLLQKEPRIEPLCCVTAQHRELLDTVLHIFRIRPDYDLNVMQPKQTLSSITTRVLDRMDEVLGRAQPDLVLVHGDTTTAFAGALSAFYHRVRVGHVEAGLRSFNKFSPFPEEMNRSLIGRIADLHFCPTELNRDNLAHENIRDHVFVTGNTSADTVHLVAREGYRFKTPALSSIDFDHHRVVLLTAHRRENYGEPFEHIFGAVLDLCRNFPDLLIVYPVHPSPAVRDTARRVLGDCPQVRLTEPLPVDDNINLMRRCTLVLTDSGGIQEEAPALGKPVLVLRTETERPEAVRAGTVAIAGVERRRIFEMASKLLSDPGAYRRMAHAVNPYGDGHASERIIRAILSYYGLEKPPEPFGGSR